MSLFNDNKTSIYELASDSTWQVWKFRKNDDVVLLTILLVYVNKI
jgi:hypothetical protein